MAERVDARVSSLIELDACLNALASVREPRVIVRPEGKTAHEWDVVLSIDPGLRGEKRGYLISRLRRMTTWADIYVQEDDLARAEKLMRWPGPMGLPFPPEVPGGEMHLPVRVVSARVEVVEPVPTLPPLILDPRPHSRFDPKTASHVLALFADPDCPPLTGAEIAEGLAARSRSVGGTRLRHTLSSMVQEELLENSTAGGYRLTRKGRHKLEELQGDIPDDADEK